MKKINPEVLQSIRFGLLFRKLALNETDMHELNKIEKEIYLNQNKIKIEDVDSNLIINNLKDFLLKSNSSQLLWLYRCISDKNGCLLYNLSPFMKEISPIVRGRLNIYKRLGWDVHVLYTYQLICDNFKSNKPTGVIGVPCDFTVFQNTINSLDDESRFILEISTFLHDIGVVDGVENHVIDGVKWVERRFNEINFSINDLSKIGIHLSIDEIYTILKFTIGNHEVINLLCSELGDLYVYSQIQKYQNLLSGYGLQFFNSNIAQIMYLISAADLMAVDDFFLTIEKTKERKESLEYFQKILNNDFFERDYIKYGIQKFTKIDLTS